MAFDPLVYFAMSKWKLWILEVPEVLVPFKISGWIMLTKDCNHQYKSRSVGDAQKKSHNTQVVWNSSVGTSTNSCMSWWFQRFLEFSAKISNWVETNHQPVFVGWKINGRPGEWWKKCRRSQFRWWPQDDCGFAGSDPVYYTEKTERRQETYPAAVFKTNMFWAADNHIF